MPMLAGDYSIGSPYWPGVGKVMEETGELQQVLGKLIATGGNAIYFDGTDLYQGLLDEIGDVLAALEFLIEMNKLPTSEIRTRAQVKLELFRRWQEEQDERR